MKPSFFRNLASREGRLDRIRFFHVSVFVLCLFIIVSFLNRHYIHNTDGSLTAYLYIKILQSMALLALWTPSMIKRLHDMDVRGNWVILSWAALLLDPRNLILIDIHAATLVNDLKPALFIFYASVMIFHVILFLAPGNPGINNWGPENKY